VISGGNGVDGGADVVTEAVGLLLVVAGGAGVVGADDVGGAGVVVVVVGAIRVVAGAEGDMLVAGASIVGVGVGVGVGDGLLVGVGRGDFDSGAVAVRDAVSRLVPAGVTPSVLTGTEAVAGEAAWLADVVRLGSALPPCIFPAAGPLLESSTATTATIAQAATPNPANRRLRGPGRREPRFRSASF
jgi:hypothetical protein